MQGMCVRVCEKEREVVCVCVRVVSKSVGELIADDSILYRQSGVMLPSLLPLSQSWKITLIEAVQIILLKVILEMIIKEGIHCKTLYYMQLFCIKDLCSVIYYSVPVEQVMFI